MFSKHVKQFCNLSFNNFKRLARLCFREINGKNLWWKYIYIFIPFRKTQINKLILNIVVLQNKKKKTTGVVDNLSVFKKIFHKGFSLVDFFWKKLMKHIIQKLYSAHIYHCAKHVNKHFPVYRNHKLRSCNTVKKHNITYSNEFDTTYKSHHVPIYKSTCNYE